MFSSEQISEPCVRRRSEKEFAIRIPKRTTVECSHAIHWHWHWLWFWFWFWHTCVLFLLTVG